MAKLTLTKRIARYLDNIGYEEVVSNSRKYRKFSHKKTPDSFIFLGKRGAVRMGKNISTSLSLTASIKNKLNIWEHKHGLN